MTKKLFISLLAILAMVSCSSDDATVDNPGGGNTGSDRYIAVNVVAPGQGTRAAEDFEDGEGNENAASSGTFLLFDANGNPTQLPIDMSLSWNDNNSTDNPQVEKISNAVLVIAGNTKPTQVLVVLNKPAGVDFSHQTLDAVRGIIADYSTTADGPFVITNSTYLDGNKETCATAIGNKIYKSKEEALKADNLVQIYVERVVAKITTTGTIQTTPAEVTIAGTTYTLEQEINGIEIANVAKTSYLFKSINNYSSWAGTWSTWNDQANYRSYWATCPEGLEFANKSWNGITDNPGEPQKYYIQENTEGQKSAVLVTATLKNKADGQPLTFLKWAGQYYLKAGFEKQYAQILTNANYRVLDGGTYRSIKADELEWLTDNEHQALVNGGEFEGWEMTMKLKEGVTNVYIKNGEEFTETTADAVNNTLKSKENRCWLWENGKCYYFVNIKHHGPVETKFNEGVVRNHVYKLTLRNLTGIGTPVFNPDETIIPDIPTDDLWYFGAQINILKWRIVGQTVDFNF